MTSSTDRNPSPPPEFLQQEHDLAPDRVGDSVFSKHWLIQVLINIVESVNKESDGKKAGEDAKSSSAIEKSTNEIKEIDQKLEDDVCALWDMSVNKDVADFLQEFKVVDILMEAIEKTKCPRLVEIAVGILGNIASFDDVCQDLSNNEALLKTIIPLSGCSDAPTVIQVLRLIRTCVVNEKCCHLWLSLLRADSHFMNNMRFILENSLPGVVLKGALQLLYYVLDNENLYVTWAEEDYMKSIASVAAQLALKFQYKSLFSCYTSSSRSRKDSNTMDELWLLLNLMCQNEKNVAAIGNHFDVLHQVFILYINLFGEYDHTVLPNPERSAAVAAGYTTFATISKGHKDRCDKLKDDTFLKTVERMYKATQGVLEKCTIIGESDESTTNRRISDKVQGENAEPTPECNGEKDCTESKNEYRYAIKISQDDYNSLFILKETIVQLCKLVMPSLVQDESDDEDDS